MTDIDAWTFGVIVGLAVITVVSRSFFFMSNSEWHLPHGIVHIDDDKMRPSLATAKAIERAQSARKASTP